jgi:hypothetical protein
VARKLEVVYERAAGGSRTQAGVRDASLGGLFIETPSPFDAGTLVSIEFTSPSGGKVNVDARVISVQKADQGDHKAGMAVRFLDLPDGAAGTLGPMFQASRPPARTYLGVGSTEVEVPKPPSVPKVPAGVARPPAPAPHPTAAAPHAPAAAAPFAPQAQVTGPGFANPPFGPPPTALSPAPATASLPGPPRQSFPPAHPAYASSRPPAPLPSSPPSAPMFRPPMAPSRPSPVVWVLVALFLVAVLGAGAWFVRARIVRHVSTSTTK